MNCQNLSVTLQLWTPAHSAQPPPPSSSLTPVTTPTTTTSYRRSACIQWEQNLAPPPNNNTQTHAGLFARRLEEEIEEYKQHSLRPGSGFHGVLRHPRDSSHTQRSVQETHANLQARRDTAQTRLVKNVGSPLIMNQTHGIVVKVWLYSSKHSIYRPSDQDGKMAYYSLLLTFMSRVNSMTY